MLNCFRPTIRGVYYIALELLVGHPGSRRSAHHHIATFETAGARIKSGHTAEMNDRPKLGSLNERANVHLWAHKRAGWGYAALIYTSHLKARFNCTAPSLPNGRPWAKITRSGSSATIDRTAALPSAPPIRTGIRR